MLKWYFLILSAYIWHYYSNLVIPLKLPTLFIVTPRYSNEYFWVISSLESFKKGLLKEKVLDELTKYQNSAKISFNFIHYLSESIFPMNQSSK